MMKTTSTNGRGGRKVERKWQQQVAMENKNKSRRIVTNDRPHRYKRETRGMVMS